MATSATFRRLRPHWIPRPHAGHFLITFRCNLKCAGCGSWQVSEHDDLSADEWRAVFRQLRSLDLVKILGGEPLVRRDLPEILTAVREEIDPYILQVTTNGMLRERLVDAIEQVGWPGLQLRISIDGLEATHDRIRGVPGSWKIVTETARAVAALRPRYGFRFGINFAVTDDSIDELEDMIALAESLGADLIPGVNVDPFLVGTKPPEEYHPKVIMLSSPERAMRALADRRVGTRSQLPAIDHLVGRFLTRSTFEAQLLGQSQQFLCRELRDLMYVLPNGDLVRCGLDHRPAGNLRGASFDELWFSDALDVYRKRVDDCPGCLQASVQILSRLYGGCLFS